MAPVENLARNSMIEWRSLGSALHPGMFIAIISQSSRNLTDQLHSRDD
jgi:hypothetical protein